MKRSRREDANFVTSASKKTKHLKEQNQHATPEPSLCATDLVQSPVKEARGVGNKQSRGPVDFSSVGMSEFLKLDVVTSAKTGRVRLRSQKDEAKKLPFVESKENEPEKATAGVSVRDIKARFTPSKDSDLPAGSHRPLSYSEDAAVRRGSHLHRGRGIARGTPVAKEQLRTPKRVASAMDQEDSFESVTVAHRLSFDDELKELNVNIKALTERYDSDRMSLSPANETKTPGRQLQKSSGPCKQLDVLATPGHQLKPTDQRPARQRSKSCFASSTKMTEDGVIGTKVTSAKSSSVSSHHDIEPDEIDIDFKNLKGLFEKKSDSEQVESRQGGDRNSGIGKRFEFDPVNFEIREVDSTPLEKPSGNNLHEPTGVLLRKPPLPKARDASATLGVRGADETTGAECEGHIDSAATPRQKKIQEKLERIKEKLNFVRRSCEISDDNEPTSMAGERSPLQEHADTPRLVRPTTAYFVDAGTPSVSFKVKAFTENLEAKTERVAIAKERSPIQSRAAKKITTGMQSARDKTPLIKQLAEKYDKLDYLHSKHGSERINTCPQSTERSIIDTHKISCDPKIKNVAYEFDRNQVHSTEPMTTAGNNGTSGAVETESHRQNSIEEIGAIPNPVGTRKRRTEDNQTGHSKAHKSSAVSPYAPTGTEAFKVSDDVTGSSINKPASSQLHEVEKTKQANAVNENGSLLNTANVKASQKSSTITGGNADSSEEWLDLAVVSNLNAGTRPEDIGLRPGSQEPRLDSVDLNLSVEYRQNMDVSSENLDDLLAGNARYHTQPVDGQQSSGDDRSSARLAPSHARHHTQPVTPTEKEAAKVVAESPPRTASGSSIADRLASLQKSGDEAWKLRIGKRDPTSASPCSSDAENWRIRDARAALLSKENSPEPVQLRGRASQLRAAERPHSIADRLNLLDTAQDSWRARVEEKDMGKFTVEGKLSSIGKTADSPIVRKGMQKKNALNRATANGESPTVHQSPLLARKTNRATMPPMMQDIALTNNDQAASTPNIPASFSILRDGERASSDSEKEPEKMKSNKVVVPRLDNETFQAFYAHKDAQVVLGNKVDVTVDDFDHVFMESEDMLISTRKTRPQHRKQRASRNPLRALAQRGDVVAEYTEELQGVAERELKRLKTEQVAGKASLATEALAGLASKESFDKSKLRKAESFSGLSPGADKFLPYSDLMLLQVKGRRTCQTRLVRPHPSSVNSGDAFILVLPDRVYVWLGEFCNVIEKAKAMDIASTIQQKRDMGCKSLFDPIVVYESKSLGSSGKEFWKHLGGFQKYQEPGPPEEDELYEMYMNETNMVYRVREDRLVPVKEYWGQLLKYEMLSTKEMYVFDFGSEVYLWTGKKVAFASRKNGLKLLEEIWKKGYDYSNCDINPISPLHTADSGGSPAKSSKRPSWALLGKVNQNMETVLFREKFTDWPDSAKVIKVKDGAEKENKTDQPVELTPCDAKAMLSGDTNPVDLVLEGSHVGRGDQWVDAEDGIRRVFEVKTLDVAVWHVLEYEHYLLDEISFGQFHEGDTYVIKWHYMLTQAGIKSLKGNEGRSAVTGREKCAYFFWQGRHSSITEKGASALMTVELDEERGPQVRVVQGKEPPAFLRLFSGRMATHAGKREDDTTTTAGDWRLYLARNELAAECYLQEVHPCVQNLRGRASFVLLNVTSGQTWIWHGTKSSSQSREAAVTCADHIKQRNPPEFGITAKAHISVKQVEEGEETTDFWKALDAVSRRHRNKYHSLQSDARTFQHSVRVFHLSSVSGTFQALEQLNPARGPHPSPFTALQTDLQRVPQPGLFLVDDAHTVYIWQGAWPEVTEEDENVTTGSAQSRFNADRVCALQTCLDYCQVKNPTKPPKALLVYGGVEPLEFQNLFPLWEVDEKAKQKQLKEGRTEGQTVGVGDLLHKLTQTKYTWEELQERPLPEGVDPSRMEKFLKESEFEKGLGMTQAEFYELPQWKQTSTKREKGLF